MKKIQRQEINVRWNKPREEKDERKRKLKKTERRTAGDTTERLDRNGK